MPRKRRRQPKRLIVFLALAAIVVALVIFLFQIRPWFAPHGYPGMPPLVDRSNIYSEAGRGRFSPATRGALARIYVPAIRSGDVTVIDPRTFRVVDRFR